MLGWHLFLNRTMMNLKRLKEALIAIAIAYAVISLAQLGYEFGQWLKFIK